jgi:hypothetical protein
MDPAHRTALGAVLSMGSHELKSCKFQKTRLRAVARPIAPVTCSQSDNSTLADPPNDHPSLTRAPCSMLCGIPPGARALTTEFPPHPWTLARV